MSVYHLAVSLGGSRTCKESSTHVVSAWHIPGGSNYEAAQVDTWFFDDEESARKVESTYSNPPEMALAFDITTYREITKRTQQIDAKLHAEASKLLNPR